MVARDTIHFKYHQVVAQYWSSLHHAQQHLPFSPANQHFDPSYPSFLPQFRHSAGGDEVGHPRITFFDDPVGDLSTNQRTA
jgi:hypothetical protein